MQKELKSLWDTCVTFHGHGCGGLAVGFLDFKFVIHRLKADIEHQLLHVGGRGRGDRMCC